MTFVEARMTGLYRAQKETFDSHYDDIFLFPTGSMR